MKHLILCSVVFFFFSSAFAQSVKKRVFTTKYYSDGIQLPQRHDTVNVTEAVMDLHFFKKHFSIPNIELPQIFLVDTLKNRKISVWTIPNGEKSFTKNAVKSYSYDSIGRLVKFDFSGCSVCATMAYSYDVVYNDKGQIEHLQNPFRKTSYRIFYSNTGDIIKFEEYHANNLFKRIEVGN